MFFGLDLVPEHPVYRVHEALETFLRNAVTENVLREELFPEWFRSIIARSGTLREKFEEAFNSLQNITVGDGTLVPKRFNNKEWTKRFRLLVSLPWRNILKSDF